MADLPYGYTVRIQSDGSSSPPASPSNQWQRQLDGQPGFTDLPGETDETYVIGKSDSKSKIRLKQKLGGGSAFSNELQVSEFVIGDFGYNGVVSDTEVTAVGISFDHKALAFGCKEGKCFFSGNGGKSWIGLIARMDEVKSVDPLYYDLDSPRLLVGGSGGSLNFYNVTEVITKDANVQGKELSNGKYIYGIGGFENNRAILTDGPGQSNTSSCILGSDNYLNWAGPVSSYHTTLSISGGKGYDGSIFAQSGLKVFRYYLDPVTKDLKMDSGPTFNTGNASDVVWQWCQSDSGVYLASGSRARIFRNESTFTNSRKWSITTCSAVPSGTKLYGCAWVKNKFWVAGIKSYLPYLASSPDGITWTSEEIPAGLPDGMKVDACKMVGHGDIGVLLLSEQTSHKTHVWSFA